MVQTLRLRAAGIGDFAAFAKLTSQLGYPVDQTELRANLERILAKDDHAVFIAMDEEGHICGWVHGYTRLLIGAAPTIEVDGMVVDSNYRGQGVGRSLMTALELWAQTRGIVGVSLRSAVQREEAHRFYRGLGYQHVKSQYAFRKLFAYNS
ncbi:GNAT family N-acetyltransferase [Burkholderiaceae bacterium DAT-1]|nr:GNAT family N-acetyltransferase [Burkholderiaceae bacterium DAT-1]